MDGQLLQVQTSLGMLEAGQEPVRLASPCIGPEVDVR